MRYAALFALLIAVSPYAPAVAAGESIPVPAGATLPQWPKPDPLHLTPDSLSVTSKDIELVHSRDALGGFEIRIAGEPMAIGQNRLVLGYVIAGQLHWLDLAQAPDRKLDVLRVGNSLLVKLQFKDDDGGAWIIDQQFAPGGFDSELDIRVRVTVDHDRAMAFLPMFQIFPGAGSFGSNKGQALLPGIEYLENEPSSSEADIVGPGSKRQVPDSLKLTFPLMAIQNDRRYLALSWQPDSNFCALFDSPDRLFGSGGHVMGVLYPESDGKNRTEGSLLPTVTRLLPVGQTLILQATIFGGLGDTLVPAVQHYVATHPFPSLPQIGSQDYISQAAGSWLDSKIREGRLFHHAIAGGTFPLQPAADAALWMEWLASQTSQTAIASRLRTNAQEALQAVRPEDWNVSGVGHVRYPVAALIYGHVEEAVAHARQSGRNLLGRFDDKLAVKYQPHAGGPDYGKTHYTNEANGVTSRVVVDLLEAAAFSGDRELLEAALKRLRAMDKFRNGVPRGAQTWECPLHIPDILASAQMVRAYTLGYELTGQEDFLEQARYWAWTGVPFVYLVNPTDKPVGPFSTIAVFGATNWKAPVWLGLPVQWCGLVYADALYRFARYDPVGPWKKLADGITISGIQQSWPASNSDLQGLLPDSFVLRSQYRNGPAINPATLQACATRLFAEAYDFHSFRQNGVRVHAPGVITNPAEDGRRISFTTQSWANGSYFVLVNGLSHKPQLKLDGKATEIAAPHQFLAKEGALILKLKGTPKVELE